MEINKIIHGDCLEQLSGMEARSIDLVYFDPPFFTQKTHSLKTRDNSKKFKFEDRFNSLQQYLELIENVLIHSKRGLCCNEEKTCCTNLYKLEVDKISMQHAFN